MMIDFLIRWSLQNRLFVFIVALLLMFWGGWQTTRMPVDVFPDLTAPSVTVVTEAHGLSPTEVENLITFPIEATLNGAPNVRRVRSNSTIGLSVITVEFAWGVDIREARQVVAEKLQLAQASLPTDIPTPQMAPAASVMGEIMFIALTSPTATGAELKTTADWVVRRRLLAVSGVAEVLTIGGDEKQYQVTLNPERLATYNISVNQVVEALKRSNHNTAAGFYQESGREYLIQGLGRVQTLEDVAKTVVVRKNGLAVLIGDLGTVEIGVGINRGTGAYDAKSAVIFSIQKQPAVNTLALTQRLDEAFISIQQSLPKDMKIESHIFRQADFIERALDNLLLALRDGVILVVAIVFAFLLSWRATFVTLVALPLSLMVAVLILYGLGATVNTMTLGGLAIALGALVDDAIIVVENIMRRLRQNALISPSQQSSVVRVVFEATREIQGSIVFATLIIMLVFLPVFLLTGVEGRLLAPLGFAYVIALAASLLVAITLTPVLAVRFLADNAHLSHREPKLLTQLQTVYTTTLSTIINHWQVISIVSVTMLLIAVIALLNAGRAFLPDFNEGSLTVNVTTLPGTSLEESDRMAKRVEAILLAQPEVIATARRTGSAPADPHAQAIYASEIETSLVMKTRSKEALLQALREDFSSLAGMSVVIGQPISHRIDHMLSGTRANIAIKLFGADFVQLRQLGEQIKTIASTTSGAVDVSLEQQADIPFVMIKLKRDMIAQYGLSVEEVMEAVQTAFAGTEVSKILEGQASFDLVVRFDPKVRRSFENLSSTLMTTPEGAQVPLSALAEIRRDVGPNLISRENVQRKLVVMANVAGRDLSSVVEDIRQQVTQQVKFPTGYYVEFGGQFESANEATRTLLIMSVVVMAGIFLLLYLAFRSSRDALVVMLNLPLALIGGVIGMYLVGGLLSVATLIGFITLFGIATRNGVMLISHIRHLHLEEGVSSPREAVLRGAKERLIPILMTALAAGLALVPLALAAGQPGSEIQAPMAVVILFGLLSSTALNMFVVPALYLRFGEIGQSQREEINNTKHAEDI